MDPKLCSTIQKRDKYIAEYMDIFQVRSESGFESDLGFFLKGRRLDPVDLEMDPNLRSVPCICLYIDLSV